jgi:hypothetical protein
MHDSVESDSGAELFAQRRRRARSQRARVLALVAAAVTAGWIDTRTVYSVTDTWKSSGTTADWNTNGNWNTTAPGNSDTALFNSTSNTTSLTFSSGSPVVGNITFDTSSVAAFTIGTTGGNVLTIADGGEIQNTSTVANIENINEPLLINGNSASYTFSSNSAATADTLNFGGSIDGNANGSHTTTLTLAGSNTGTNTGSSD